MSLTPTTAIAMHRTAYHPATPGTTRKAAQAEPAKAAAPQQRRARRAWRAGSAAVGCALLLLAAAPAHASSGGSGASCGQQHVDNRDCPEQSGGRRLLHAPQLGQGKGPERQEVAQSPLHAQPLLQVCDGTGHGKTGRRNTTRNATARTCLRNDGHLRKPW